MHVNCIGADFPGKQELDPAILKGAKIVMDDLEQGSHSSEVNVPLSQGLLEQRSRWCELGEIVAGLKQGRASNDEITVFASTVLAIQSAVTANIAYKKAMAHDLGQMIELSQGYGLGFQGIWVSFETTKPCEVYTVILTVTDWPA